MIQNLGQRLKKLREDRKLTQEELAIALGVSKATIGAYERGDNTPPADMLIKLSDIFRVTTDYILGLENNNVIVLDKLTNDKQASIKNIINLIIDLTE